MNDKKKLRLLNIKVERALKKRNVTTVSGGAAVSSPGGATEFTDLTDVPSSYSGQSLKVVRVNAGETALEFATSSGGSAGIAGAIQVSDGVGGFSDGGASIGGGDMLFGNVLISSSGIIAGLDTTTTLRGLDPGSSANGGDLLLRAGNANTSGVGGDVYVDSGNAAGASTDGNIGLFTDSVADWQDMEKGVFIADATTAPTGAPTGGLFMFAEGGQLKIWESGGGSAFTVGSGGSGLAQYQVRRIIRR